jgi:hypothetical protein
MTLTKTKNEIEQLSTIYHNKVFKAGIVCFWKFPFNIFRPWLTEGN